MRYTVNTSRYGCRMVFKNLRTKKSTLLSRFFLLVSTEPKTKTEKKSKERKKRKKTVEVIAID